MLVIQLKNTDYNTNVNEIVKKITDHSHDKYITTPEFNQRKTIIYSVHEIDRYVNKTSYSTLENCLFRAVKLRKHVDIDLQKYSGYGIGFDRKYFLQLVMKLVEM